MRTQFAIATVAIAILAFAGAAAAQDYLILDPPVIPTHPTEGQPVSARIQDRNCAATPIAVVRQGNVIELRYTQGGCPILPPITEFELPLGALPAGTYDMRLLEVGDPEHPQLVDEAVFAVDAPTCEPNPRFPTLGADSSLCIGGRFTVTAEWTAHDGSHGFGHPVPLTRESGAFWFFHEDNLELMVKVLDACSYNQRSWVFGAGLTDVGVVLRVFDGVTNTERSYVNERGHAFQPVTDTNAFAGCATP
jgi:hypothetical protein